ncbi:MULTISPECIES: glycosyltransferase family 2 protein [unclassified Mameliella]|uniref:glycosyltransferase family 2 protein n=1 Tax=unclassified Mameliella TaxID=2630630 RepID=UPI00273E4DF4|nr:MULTISPECIES: glycosyltransferase family 2 protein [unclassified Mameliella]
MTDHKLPVTVAIPVRNEEKGLPACLERLSRFADVVVIDSGSTDRTVEIAEGFGARVLQFTWDGSYPKKRNWMLLNHPPAQPWVLFLDADEIVDDAFCDALAEALERGDCDGYWLSYANTFLGRPLRHGLQQRKLALFRVGRGLYERIDENGWSGLDMEIHEHPIVDGPVGEIAAQIEHRDDRGLARFLTRHVDYARWEARRLRALEEDQTAWENLTRRQQFKYRHLRRWWYPWFYFLGTYVGKGGFRDGAAGLEYAFYKAWYFQTIRLMLKE